MNGSSVGQWVAISRQEAPQAWLVCAQGTQPRGTVLMLHEIFGINAAMRDEATRLAAQGFDVLLPDLYGRLQPRVDLGYGEAERTQGFQLMQRLDQEQAMQDCAEAADWARRQPRSNAQVAVLGFCLGGLIAVRFAARYACDAVISYYGVRVNEYPTQLQAIACPLQYHVGAQDSHIGPERVAGIRAALAGRPHASVYEYAAAQHGFANRLRSDVFAPAAAALAATRVNTLLQEQLG